MQAFQLVSVNSFMIYTLMGALHVSWKACSAVAPFRKLGKKARETSLQRLFLGVEHFLERFTVRRWGRG